MIPTGFITFLFTDIEGSTRLSQEYPDSYNDLLSRHDLILTEVIESNNGFIFKKIGDSFCSSFESTESAVLSAIEIQKRFQNEFKDDIVIKVRMGIHSGEAEYIKEDYAGYVTLSKTQRIMSIAHGGQILVTRKIRDFILNYTKNNITFRDFGKRKLKDIVLSEQIYQVISEGLRKDFPPLKSADARQTNIPVSDTTFIGRKNEIEKIRAMFSEIRLLTLTGAGGTGKTRLAIEIVKDLIDEFENGIWFIELSSISDPELIVKEISSILNLKEEPGLDGLLSLKQFLKVKNILLIFDNCEHLLLKCAQIAEALLSYCPKLKIISTSRESLNIRGENIYRIPSLSMPEDAANESYETLSEYESVKLFLNRARSVNRDFTLTKDNIFSVSELCKKLDGIPLAIELASKRINILPVDKILERLHDRFKLLNTGNSTALPRQKTLKALIDWSYDLLIPNEQLLLQRLSLFMGGWTLEAAEEICSDDTIDQFDILDLMDSLLNKSLIFFNEINGDGRYGILESIKYYAQEKLSDKEKNYQKQFAYFLNLSSFSLQKEKGKNQLEWLSTMYTELDNIRDKIQWAVLNKYEQVVRLVINTFDFWLTKGYIREGYDTSLKILNTFTIKDKKLKADLLDKLANFCYELGKIAELEEYSAESLKLYREMDDKIGIISTLNALGQKFIIELDDVKAVKLFEEALSLSIEINSDESKVKSLYNLSFPVSKQGDFKRSVSLKEEALKISRELKNEYFIAWVLLSLSVKLAQSSSDTKKAALYSEESLIISRKIDDKYLISVNLVHLADLKLNYDKPNFEEAEYILFEAYKISKDFGYSMNLFPIRNHLGELYIQTKNFNPAIEIYKEYLEERDKPGGDYFINNLITGMGRIFYERDDYMEAVPLFAYVETKSKTDKYKPINKNLNLNESEKNNIIMELGEENFNFYWNEGENMTIDKAIQKCLNINIQK